MLATGSVTGKAARIDIAHVEIGPVVFGRVDKDKILFCERHSSHDADQGAGQFENTGWTSARTAPRGSRPHTEQPVVADAASELLRNVLGEGTASSHLVIGVERASTGLSIRLSHVVYS
jgi:hypothetical protein